MALEMVLGSKFLSLRFAAAAASVPDAASRLPVAMGPSVCAYTRECKVSIGESKAMVPATMTARLCRIFFLRPPSPWLPGKQTPRRRRHRQTPPRICWMFSIAFCAAFILSSRLSTSFCASETWVNSLRNDSTMDFTRSAP